MTEFDRSEESYLTESGLSRKYYVEPTTPAPEYDYAGEAIRSAASLQNEQAMRLCTFGLYQWLFLIFMALAIASDGVEIFMIALIMPSAERDLCMDTTRQGYLSIALFVGMIIGCITWGTKGDRDGRRATLLISLGISVAVSIYCIFAPNYISFCIGRFIIGAGLGGAMPLVLAYYGELCPKDGRGVSITYLTAAWMGGSVYASVAAYIIIPDTIDGLLESSLSFHMAEWRWLLMVCAIPGLAAWIGIFFFYESPLFLLEQGRFAEAYIVYKNIYAWNHTNEKNTGFEDELKGIIFGPEQEELSRVMSEKSNETALKRLERSLRNGFSQVAELFGPRYRKTSTIVVFQWMTLSAALYGIATWYPTYLIDIEEAETTTYTYHVNQSFTNMTFTYALTDKKFQNCTFTGVTFDYLVLDDVTFTTTVFENTTFKHVRNANGFFVSCVFVGTLFDNYDFYSLNYQNSQFINCTFRDDESCKMDFGSSYDVKKVYIEDVIGSVCYFPTIFLHGYIADAFGRKSPQIITSFIAAVATLAFWVFDYSETVVVIAYCIYAMAVMMPENGLSMLTIEMFPTHLRGTGNGLSIMLAKFMTIGILLLFTYCISDSKEVPIFFTSGMLLLTALSSFWLPESKNWLL